MGRWRALALSLGGPGCAVCVFGGGRRQIGGSGIVLRLHGGEGGGLYQSEQHAMQTGLPRALQSDGASRKATSRGRNGVQFERA